MSKPSGASELPQLFHLAQNAVEDPRVHVFLKRRTPGVKPWLSALFATDPEISRDDIGSEVLSFLQAAAACDRGRGLGFLRRQAALAFKRTATARQAYANSLPPSDFSLMPVVAARYLGNVASRFSPTPPLPSPPHQEIAVRCAAYEAQEIFTGQVWPEVLRLARLDEAKIAAALDRDDALRGAAEAARAGTTAAADCATRALSADATARKVNPGTLRVAQKIYRSWWKAITSSEASTRRRFLPGPVVPGLFESPGGSKQQNSESAGDEPAPPAMTPPAAARLTRELKRLLPRSNAGWLSGYASGARLALPRAMLASATGQGFESVWRRRRRENRTAKLAVSLLVDASGSMAHDGRIEAATEATQAFAIALDRIPAIDWSVSYFQDEVHTVIPHGEGLSKAGRSAIERLRASVHASSAQWNDDGPALSATASALARRPARQKLLIVMSDGRPAGRHSNSRDLRTAVAAVSAMPGMTLIGLGLGKAGTEAVAEFYARAEVNIEPSELPERLGKVLRAAFKRATVRRR